MTGGATRQQSVEAGLKAVVEGIVVIHDGARPFVDCTLLNGALRLVGQNLDGIACAVPVKVP